jgi:hypothetical protein
MRLHGRVPATLIWTLYCRAASTGIEAWRRPGMKLSTNHEQMQPGDELGRNGAFPAKPWNERVTAAFDRHNQHRVTRMRILPLAIIGLAVLGGCASRSQQSAAPPPQPVAPSGAATMTAPPQGDSIDRFAAAYAAEHPMRRY